MDRWQRRRLNRRAVSPVIATVLLISMTMVLVSALYYMVRTPLAPQPPTIQYSMTYTNSEPAYGDGSDCTGTVCKTLPALLFTLTQVTPGQGGGEQLYNQTKVVFWCNGTIYLEGSLYQLTWNPASGGTPGPSAPQLQTCGGFVPPTAPFNRMMFWQPQNMRQSPGFLSPGDTLVVFVHEKGTWLDTDDDYHGTPAACYQTPGSCYIYLYSTGALTTLFATIPVNPPTD